MQIKVGKEILGDYPEQGEDNIFVSGLTASGDGDTVIGKGKATADAGKRFDRHQRIKDKGNIRSSVTIPTSRTFETPSEALRWIMETAAVGGYSGRLLVTYDDNNNNAFDYAIARPSSLSHQGVRVLCTWAVTFGKQLN